MKRQFNDDKEFRLRLINDRGGKCEICGAKNGSLVIRSNDNSEYITFDKLINGVGLWDYGGIKMFEQQHVYFDLFDMTKKPIKIVLRIAHKDHNKLHNEPNNIMLLCQLHHNRHTAEIRSETKKRSAYYKRNQMTLDEAIKC